MERNSKRRASGSPRRVGLFGPYVSRNLGDTATQLAVIQNLRQRRPDLQILGIAPEPDDTLRSLGIAAFPLSGYGPIAGDLAPYEDLPSAAQSDVWRRPYSPVVLRRIARFVRTLDLLIISGGGQLDDFWGGAWAHPWSMLVWTAMARRYGIPVVYLAVGLDGLEAALSRRFSLLALNMATRRLFRDTRSLEELQAQGLVKPSSVCPDLAFSLNVETQALDLRQSFAVISPISRKTWSHQETDIHGRYMAALADVGRELAGRGCALKIVCSQTVMDLDDAHALAKRLQDDGVAGVVVHDAPRVADFVESVRGADLVVASRLHAVILSLVAECPVLAVAHLDKVRAVMDDIGHASYCLPLQQIESGPLRELACQALDRSHELRQHIKREVAGFRTRLENIFDEMATLSDAPASLGK